MKKKELFSIGVFAFMSCISLGALASSDHHHEEESKSVTATHEHEHEHEQEQEHEHGHYASVEAAWKQLNDTVTQAEALVVEGNFKTIDTLNHEIELVVHYLQDNAQVTEVAAQTRLEGGLKQLSFAADRLHKEAHTPTREVLEKTLKKLRGSMKVVEAQYPGQVVK